MDRSVFWHLCQAPQPTVALTALTPAERATYEGFRFDARRRSWLSGRFTAKALLSKVYDRVYSHEQIEIVNNDLGAPGAYHANQAIPGCLSISHSGNWAAAAYAPSGLEIGIDIEYITQHSAAFIQDYFTKKEVNLLCAENEKNLHTIKDHDADRSAEKATLIWSAKEALLKAMGIGLRIDTHQVEVISIKDDRHGNSVGWNRLELSTNQISKIIDAYWQKKNGFMLTLVVLRDDHDSIALSQV